MFEGGTGRRAVRGQATPGGRGTVAFVTTAQGRRWVLRHYRRGGLVARWLDDRYAWRGQSRTRSFAEWRLLRQLRAWNLPVPSPSPHDINGTAGSTAQTSSPPKPTRVTLAAALGRALRRRIRGWPWFGASPLHGHGAYTTQTSMPTTCSSAATAGFVLDFDCGRIRPGAWERQVLARCSVRSKRSLRTGRPVRRRTVVRHCCAGWRVAPARMRVHLRPADLSSRPCCWCSRGGVPLPSRNIASGLAAARFRAGRGPSWLRLGCMRFPSARSRPPPPWSTNCGGAIPASRWSYDRHAHGPSA